LANQPPHSQGADVSPAVDRLSRDYRAINGNTRGVRSAIPDVNRLHRPIPDPAKARGTQEEVVGVFRAMRDDIARRVSNLLG